jgi:hypothetical protein
MTPVTLDFATSVFFWGFLVVYGATMYVLSPQARSVSSFFRGADDAWRGALARAPRTAHEVSRNSERLRT